MDQRTREILKLLLKENTFQTTAYIAERLSVSAKTISRQLPKVEEILNHVGLQLEKKSGAGLLVIASEVKRYALLKRLQTEEKKEYTPSERRSIIISKLLSSREPIKLFALSSAVHVTDSTISNDLDKLEPWFREQGLKLLRKPGLGVSLLGDERDLRRAIRRAAFKFNAGQFAGRGRRADNAGIKIFTGTYRCGRVAAIGTNDTRDRGRFRL